MESKGYSLEYGRHYYSENRSGLYPNYPSPDTETLIISEAIIDAATLLQVPEISSLFAILAAYGTNGLTKEHKQAIAEWCSSEVENKEIIFFFDGDAAGREGVQRNAEELQKLFIAGISTDARPCVSFIETPPDEDINSLYIKHGAECLMQLINERKPINEPSFSIEILSNEKEEVQAQHTLSPLDTANPNKITYETPSARYIIKGGICKPLDKMLVSLDVQHLETALKYRTRLDLYEERQTRKEAREAAEKLDLRSDLLETDLSKLTDLLEEHREREFENLKKNQ
jgi:DNA primase